MYLLQAKSHKRRHCMKTTYLLNFVGSETLFCEFSKNQKDLKCFFMLTKPTNPLSINQKIKIVLVCSRLHYVLHTVTEQDPMRPSQNRPPPMSTCLLSVDKLQSKNKFNQRSEKMQKERKTVKQDKIIILQPLNKVQDLQFFLKDYR